MGLESYFWGKLSDNLDVDYLERVENKVGAGWPDTYGLHEGQSFWIELKAEKEFPNRIDFQPAQPLWLTNHWQMGGVCYVMLYVESHNQIYVWAGKHAKELGKPGGTKKITPLIQVTMNSPGWHDLYDLFRKDSHYIRAVK